MTTIPFLVRVAEKLKVEMLATILAWPGYIWMGFLFIFCSILLFIDLVKIIYKLIISRFIGNLQTYISSINSCMFALALAICASVYAFIEAGQIRVDHVNITSSKLPTSISRIRIVQISDLHVGLLLQKARLQHILEKVKEAKPDILVSTGDLVDGKLNRDNAISELNPMAALLENVPTPFGKYAIIGNHEVYAGLPQSIAFSRAAGFTLLRNQVVLLSNGITISGVDDPAIKPEYLYNPNVEIALLNSISKKTFNIFLKHRPDILPESDGHFDLQLSGHVHGGQIFPFNFLVKLKHAIPCGTTITPAGSQIHVSRGTGTWGPPMRLFVPPEVTIIDIFSSGRR